jgi:hypothetical protein
LLTITTEAQEHIRRRNLPVFLEMPIVIQGDITIRESPAVRWGIPQKIDHYERQTIGDVEIYIPHELPAIPLTIVRRSFLGFKWLAVEGWALA